MRLSYINIKLQPIECWLGLHDSCTVFVLMATIQEKTLRRLGKLKSDTFSHPKTVSFFVKHYIILQSLGVLKGH